MNAPTTGPVVRLNGYSMTSGAVSTSPCAASATAGNVAQTRTRSRLLRSRPVADRQPLEEPTALSESVLWSLQREYYQRKGIQAWSGGVVPDMITTNAVMGAAYARMVAAFLREWRAADGRRSWRTRCTSSRSARAPDGSPTTSSRSSRPASRRPGAAGRHRAPRDDRPPGRERRPLAAASATSDATPPPDGSTSPPSTRITARTPIHLVESGTVLRARGRRPRRWSSWPTTSSTASRSTPSSSTTDGLAEYLVGRHRRRGPTPGGRRSMDDVELSMEPRARSATRPRYRDAELEALLRGRDGGRRTPERAVPDLRDPPPPGAAAHDRRARSSSCPPTRATAARRDRVFEDGPYMAIHGSVSFIGRLLGARRLRASPRAASPCSPGHRREQPHRRLLRARRQARRPGRASSRRTATTIEVGGPDDFFSLDQVLSDAAEHADARPAPRPPPIGRVGPARCSARRLRRPDGASHGGGSRRAGGDPRRGRATSRSSTSRSARRPTSRSPWACSVGAPGDAMAACASCGGRRSCTASTPSGPSPWGSATSPPATSPRPWTRPPPRSGSIPTSTWPGSSGCGSTGEGRTAAGADPLEWGSGLVVTEKIDGQSAFLSRPPALACSGRRPCAARNLTACQISGFFLVAAADPDREALVAPDGTSLSAGELAALANRISNGLLALGVRPDDTLALVLPERRRDGGVVPGGNPDRAVRDADQPPPRRPRDRLHRRRLRAPRS